MNSTLLRFLGKVSCKTFHLKGREAEGEPAASTEFTLQTPAIVGVVQGPTSGARKPLLVSHMTGRTSNTGAITSTSQGAHQHQAGAGFHGQHRDSDLSIQPAGSAPCPGKRMARDPRCLCLRHLNCCPVSLQAEETRPLPPVPSGGWGQRPGEARL